ncbi:hypothetical protein [Leptospira phage LE3]|uniref:Uncharacterized protein n=2 Tax=Nylescharonvirus TaxID=2843431 RepID=A0A343LEI5_9CAUD|nr:hypothetical protein HWB33_gp01 [Leptospira phage LE3]YP_009835476.1 hypothetical protein HWB34_gp01 [Leptospira phage LE4]ATN94993.1 hypothetical protein [Leptospira phage LE3]ATN95095.1 hypothetical protein [Leptospira phage LE4]
MKDLAYYLFGYMDGLPQVQRINFQKQKFKDASAKAFELGYSFMDVLKARRQMKKENLV